MVHILNDDLWQAWDSTRLLRLEIVEVLEILETHSRVEVLPFDVER